MFVRGALLWMSCFTSIDKTNSFQYICVSATGVEIDVVVLVVLASV